MMRLLLPLLAAALLALAMSVPASARREAGSAGTVATGNAVTDWALIAQNAIAPGRPPGSGVVLMGILQAAVYAARPVAGDHEFEGFSEWSSPANLGLPLNTSAEESAPALSDDGRSLYFNRNLNLPDDNDEDIYVSHRNGPHQEWGHPAPVVAINTPAFHERNATLSRDGRLLFFSSSRPGGFGGLDLYVSGRMDRNDDQGWSTPVNLGPAVNSAAADVGPAYVEDEAGSTVLYFTSNRPAPAGFGAADIYVSRLGADGSFGSAALVPELSSQSGDARPAIRTDGLELLLHSNRPGALLSCPVDTPTPSGGQDLWVATRATSAATWSCPVNLGPAVNSAANDLQAALSDDGELLLFSSNRSGGMGSDDLWMSGREPEQDE